MKKFKVRQIYLLFMLILSVFLITGCSGGETGKWLASTPAATPGVIPGACTVTGPTIPAVTSSNPTDGNLNVTTSTTGFEPSKLITANFSLAMDPTTIESATPGVLTTFTIKETVGGANVEGTVAMNPAHTVATFTTTLALSVSTEYTVTITTAAMSAGHIAMGCSYEWTFTTADAEGSGLAPVNPGLLDPFAMASYAGITDTGATKVNGNVVIDTGLTCSGTGGPMAVGSGNDFGDSCNAGANIITNNAGDLVITQVYPDTTTADAVMVELLAKWNSISPAGTAPAVPTDLTCPTIGTLGGAPCVDFTYPPGVYLAASGTSIGITGTLTLDAGDNPDAVWIFQAGSTLDLNVSSSILLTGGAKASNVWWYVGSSATLYTDSVFQGNILASASITMQNGATSCGRLLAGAEGGGAFTFDTNIVSVPGNPNAPAVPLCE
jgi:hypothetical protein